MFAPLPEPLIALRHSRTLALLVQKILYRISMTLEDIRKPWHEAMKAAISEFKDQVIALGVDVIEGQLSGSGHTLIQTDFSYLENQGDLLRQQGSLAVLDIEYFALPIQPRMIQGFALHVRLGTTNTWMSSSMSMPDPEEDEEDDEEDDGESVQVESTTLTKLALIAARSPEFGRLKNKGQRQNLVSSILNNGNHPDIPSHYAPEIASRAEGVFEFGVLPEQARTLLSQGKSILEISKLLGLTKQRIERALSAQTPNFIIEAMKT